MYGLSSPRRAENFPSWYTDELLLFLLFRFDEEPGYEYVEICDGGSRIRSAAARSPYLADKSIPLAHFDPRFANIKKNTKVSMLKYDPYEMGVTPEPAEFLRTWRPADGIKKYALRIGGLGTEKDLHAFAWYFDDVFSQQECREVINMANQKKFVPAFSNNQGNYDEVDPRKRDEMEYDPERLDAYISMFDCPELMRWVYAALEPYLKDAPVPEGWRVDHINSFARTLLYAKAGQKHQPHFDEMMPYPKSKSSENHEWSNARSVWTVMIYLSEVPLDSGGCTCFSVPGPPLGPSGNGQQLREIDQALFAYARDKTRCQCVPGRVLIFSQNLCHADEPLLDDCIKYLVRSDVMALPVGDE